MPTYKNSYYAYIENGALDYPSQNTSKLNPIEYNTGYHRIPNQVWGNYLHYGQWYDMMANNSAFCVKSVSCTVSNMIPLTEQSAIQGNATFTTFNNTIYAICYDDVYYETEFEEEVSPQETLFYREGKITNARYMLPTYKHGIYAVPISGSGPSPIFAWDPLVNAEEILELRPGKNAVKFTWTASEDIWMNTQMCQSFDPSWTPGAANTSTAYTIDHHNMWGRNITPHHKLNYYVNTHDTGGVTKQAIKTPGFPGFNYDKPINNWFIKMIPLYDSNNALIKTTAQVLITMSITLDVKPAKHAMNAPCVPYHSLITIDYQNQRAYWYGNNIGLQNKGSLYSSGPTKGSFVPALPAQECKRMKKE